MKLTKVAIATLLLEEQDSGAQHCLRLGMECKAEELTQQAVVQGTGFPPQGPTLGGTGQPESS